MSTAKATLAISPPTEPSMVFFGLISGESLCLPKAMPENSANTSLTEARKNESISAAVASAVGAKSCSENISENRKPGYTIGTTVAVRLS